MPRPMSVDEALALILEATPVLAVEEVGLEGACGRILREPVRADRDYPPFDKAMMDGYAVVAADLTAVPRELEVIQEIAAGADPLALRRIEPGRAARIMTGAPMPPGADAVLIVEETAAIGGRPDGVLARGSVAAGQNRALRGTDLRAGEELLSNGDFIGPAEIAVLATCGCTRIPVGGRPRVAVLSTGDELVPPDQEPGSGRIRNSNGPMLMALAGRAGAVAETLGIAADEPQALQKSIDAGLGHDVLMLSGGVSMGRYDLVGDALRALGVEILFDQVAIKPGRPFTFGRRGRTLVFGCPGNPVSTYVIFHVFARPALRRMMGFRDPSPAPVRGVLASPARQRPGRAGYYQAHARFSGSGYEVTILPSSGSADFISCARGNALAIMPADAAQMPAGAAIDTLLLDDHHDR